MLPDELSLCPGNHAYITPPSTPTPGDIILEQMYIFIARIFEIYSCM